MFIFAFGDFKEQWKKYLLISLAVVCVLGTIIIAGVLAAAAIILFTIGYYNDAFEVCGTTVGASLTICAIILYAVSMYYM